MVLSERLEDEEPMEEDESLEEEKRLPRDLREREEEERLAATGMTTPDFRSPDRENFGMVGSAKSG